MKRKVFVFLGVPDDKSEYVSDGLLRRGRRQHVNRPAKGAVDVKLMKEWIAESYGAVAPKKRTRAK